MDELIDKLEALAQAASPGPWTSMIEGRDHMSGSNFIMVGQGADRLDDIELHGATLADQDFIAAVRDGVPLLIAEIWRLRGG